MDDSASEFVSLWTRYQREVRRQRQARERLIFSEEIIAQLHETIGDERWTPVCRSLARVNDSSCFVVTPSTVASNRKRSRRKPVHTFCTTPSKNCDFACWRALTAPCSGKVDRMAKESKQQTLDRLIARLLHGDATPEDIAALEKRLDGNADAQMSLCA